MNIKPGALLGILAPSSPCDPQIVIDGLDWIHQAGFRTRVAGDPSAAWTQARHLFSSDTPQARLAALYDLFEDPEVDAIICVRGGYGAMELLPLLDLGPVSRNPKPFIGISDVTVLLNLFAQRTAVPVIHGPVFGAGFSKASTDSLARLSCQDLFELLGGRAAGAWQENLCLLRGEDSFEGPVMGGNLSMLAALCGTPWAPVYDGQVLFFEDVGERPYRLHRLLTQLKLAGSLDQLKGVVVGELLNCAPPESTSTGTDEVLRDIFAEFSYPVVTGAPFGHGSLNRAFVIGQQVSYSAGVLRFG